MHPNRPQENYMTDVMFYGGLLFVNRYSLPSGVHSKSFNSSCKLYVITKYTIQRISQRKANLSLKKKFNV